MLEGLYAGALADAEARLAHTSIAQLERQIDQREPALDVLKLLAPRENIHVLAEIKRASPSRGDLSEIADPVALAKIYSQGGASAISVLTEQRKFKGSLDDLAQVRAEVEVPLLRKDFIANEQQILEARAFGADIFLLIVAGLDQATLTRLKTFGEQLGMTAFVETHSVDEVSRALDADTRLLGVNARDLSTFQTDRNLFANLVEMIPAGVIKVAESAVRDVEDVRHYRATGADVVLVGEALVTGDAGQMLCEFLAV